MGKTGYVRRLLVLGGVAAAGLGAAPGGAQAASLGDRPLSPLRSWGEATGQQLGTERAGAAQVARRLSALKRVVTASAPKLRRAGAVVKTRELARSRVVLGAALDPLAGTLKGTARDLFYVSYQHELERLAVAARLDRTPTGRPLQLSAGQAVAALAVRVRPDSDGDGISDAEEIDDDGDGIVDRSDTSDQGWGIPDALQAREDLDDDVDEDGTADVVADSLQVLRGLTSPEGLATSPLGERGSGAYCLFVTERVPSLSTVAATRNLRDIAASRGCRATPKVDAPEPESVAKGGPILDATVRDATASGRTMLLDVRVDRAARLDVVVSQRVVVAGGAGSVRFEERSAKRNGIRIAKGRRTISVPLPAALGAGAAQASVTVKPVGRRLGRQLSVPVTVIGSARVSSAAPPAVLPPPPAGAPSRAPGTPVRILGAAPDGPNRVILTFDGPIGPSADDPSNYTTAPNLFVTGAARLPGLTQVVLTTGRQFAIPYTITATGLTDAGGVPLADDGRSAGFTGGVPLSADRPRVTSAGSTGNRSVLVQFSKPLADSALEPTLYQVVRDTLTTESGGVDVVGAAFADDSRLGVLLTTGSQNEVNYRVRVTGITDISGLPLADKTGAAAAVDPTSASFGGTPPGNDRADTDCDGVSDNEEAVGYSITVVRASGQEIGRDVTSDPGRPGLNCENPSAEDDRNGDGRPDSADTDRDGLTDDVEKNLATDPRDADTDDDALTDDVEFNEIFSEPLVQDTDEDSLTDGLELTFFSTSALLDDTDGDQIADDTEITLGNRNPRVSDLPKPGLEIGEADLRLDVRFTDVTGTESKVVDTKSVAAELRQSDSQKFSTSDQRTIEAGTKLTTEAGFELEVAAGPKEVGARVGKKFNFKTTTEQSFNSQFVTQWGEESASETQRAHSTSQQSQVEQGQSTNRTREVVGAAFSAGVVLRTSGDIAFTLKDLQLSAFIQDPQQPTRLTPVATLRPVAEPDSGFTLGPLVPERGPIIFQDTQVFPALVEELMRNPRGLVFRFSNYDVTDELGRNFAFTSQAVNDRTAGLVIDFGGFDSDDDGVGDETESRRVATGTGRRIDSNGDGKLDGSDRKAVFGPDGKHLGITLRDALAAIGLTEYDETLTPTESLTQQQIDSSYSIVPNAAGGEQLWRVRRTGIEPGVARTWEILGPEGIDSLKTLDEQILGAGQSFTLAFLQDADQDRVPAIVENLNRCVDSPTDADGDGLADSLDSDGDGLDDRFEVYIGWRTTVERGSRQVRSRCASADTDADGRPDDEEAPGIVRRDADGQIEFTTGRAPERDTSAPEDPLLGWALTDPITDPTSTDTDLDGLGDDFELDGFAVELISPPAAPGTFTAVQPTSPEHFDSDRDTASDGVEKRIGGDPRRSDFENFGDSDGDGLVNVLETTPYDVTWRRQFDGPICDSVCSADGAPVTTSVTSRVDDPDSDDDGLPDGEERDLGTNPNQRDTDGEGLSDFEEVRGSTLPDLGIVTTDPLRVDTDRDKRNDGEEAGRTGFRIIVRVPGEDPYLATSDPRNPDQDFDRLVDGDERVNGTDPKKANTDGDNQSDYEEVQSSFVIGKQRRPLVPDLYVEVVLAGMDVKSDGDGGDNGGDFEFGLTVRNAAGVRICDPSECVNGPREDLRPFPVNSHVDGGIDLPNCGDADQLSSCRQDDRHLQARDDRGEIPFRRTIRVGSVSISPKKYESFQIDGFVQEFEDGDQLDCNIVFPNPLKADEAGGDSGIFPGSTLEPGVKALTLTNKATCRNEGNSADVELRAFYTAG